MFPLDAVLQGLGLVYSALPIAFVVYFLLLHDARRKDSPAAADTQLGIKTVAATIVIIATVMFALGLQAFLHVILTFTDFVARIKLALPDLVFGGVGVIGAAFVLFPRTNAATFPKAKRLAAGVVAIVSGAAVLPALAGFLQRLLTWSSWDDVARGLSFAVVAVVVFAASFAVLGRLSGIDMKSAGTGIGTGVAAHPVAAPMQQMPQQQMPQQQAAYPQAYPGYPPQQGGAPMQPQQQGQPGQGIGPGWPPPGGQQ